MSLDQEIAKVLYAKRVFISLLFLADRFNSRQQQKKTQMMSKGGEDALGSGLLPTETNIDVASNKQMLLSSDAPMLISVTYV